MGEASILCPDGAPRNYPRYEITQRFTVAEIMPGYKTPVFGYNGEVPGPTLRMTRGAPVVVRQTNALQQPPAAPYQSMPMPSKYTSDPWQRSTSTHLHGSASLPQYDGYASDLTFPGQVKKYFYPNSQDARTLWYHDHGVHHTSQNAYNGLAGLYILHDEEEASLGIPTGAPGSPSAPYDVPMIVRDAMFATDGTVHLRRQLRVGGLRRRAPDQRRALAADGGRAADLPLPDPQRVGLPLVRVALSDGRSTVPMTVIGTDGGLMPQPKVVSKFRHGMAERYEIIIDFSKYKGARITLKNRSRRTTSATTRSVRSCSSRSGHTVTNDAGNAIPADWSEKLTTPECMTWTESELLAQGALKREFKFIRSNSRWTINGETWENVIDSDYTHCMAEPSSGRWRSGT